MSKRYHLVGLALLGLLACLVAFQQREPESVNAATRSGVITEPELDPELREELFHTHEHHKTVRVVDLTVRNNDRQKRQAAALKTEVTRRPLQLARREDWRQMIATNSELYRQLRLKASTSPHGVTPCTICDGLSYMHFCVMCKKNDGKCPTCKGTGLITVNDYCPTCTGSGKCYICNGTGRMLCAFCDDGMIDIRRPPPSMSVP
jgi:hypothetical protein